MNTLQTIKDLVTQVGQELGVQEETLLFRHTRTAAHARYELFWRCRQLNPQPSYAEIARALGFDKATVQAGVKRRNGEPPRGPTSKRCGQCGKRFWGRFCSAKCGLEVTG